MLAQRGDKKNRYLDIPLTSLRGMSPLRITAQRGDADNNV